MQVSRIICIGRQRGSDDDARALKYIGEWLAKRQGYEALAARIVAEDLDVYDMSTQPKKGDGIKALLRYRDVEAVVALHIFGIDFTENMIRSMPRLLTHDFDLYARWNHMLLDICTRRGLPLIAWGDQPCHYDGSRREQIVGSAYLYERKRQHDLKATQGSDSGIRRGLLKVQHASRGTVPVL